MTTLAAPRPSGASRYSGLDGLRAVAVLLVVVYHLFPAWFLRSGFVGVDVFFVISGFLITSLLLREHAASGRIALRAFWTRRARRLLPALAAVVTVSATAAWLVGGDVLVGLGRQVLGAATFSYNWVAVADGASYFSGSQPELFRNLWSLAVEEQFYLLWPLLLPLLLLVRARWQRVAIAVGLAAASAGWAAALVLAGAGVTRAYYGTDTHAFGLLIGVALAVALSARAAGVARAAEASGVAEAGRAAGSSGVREGSAGWTRFGGAAVGVAALVALVAVAAWPDGASLYPGVPLLASVLSAVAIAAAVQAGSWIGRALDVAPLRWIGERSYGIYLWHWPIVVLLTVALTDSFADAAIPVGAGVTAMALTLAVSALSYRVLEQPVRRLGFGGALRALRAGLSANPVRRFGAIAALAAGVLAAGGTTAAVAAAPPVSSSEAVVQAGIDALARASATPVPAVSGAGAPPSGATDGSGATNGSGATDGTGGPQGSEALAGSRAPRESAPGSATPEPSDACADTDTGTGTGTAADTGADRGAAASPDARTEPCTGRDGRPLAPPPVTVPGDRVTAIGDSVMLASASGLLARLPGIQIDAAVSRSMWAGTDIIGGLAAQGALRDFVVVGLGTNGPVDAGALQDVYDALGPQRTLVLVTAFAPRDWIAGVNSELAGFAASHPRVVIADWSQAIAPHLDLLAGDQIHPGPTGGEVYATTVADAVDGVENQRAQVRYEVELIRWSTERASELVH